MAEWLPTINLVLIVISTVVYGKLIKVQVDFNREIVDRIKALADVANELAERGKLAKITPPASPPTDSRSGK